MSEDPLRTSRLFYLQLYSDLATDKEIEERRRAAERHFRALSKRRSGHSILPVKLAQWMGVLDQDDIFNNDHNDQHKAPERTRREGNENSMDDNNVDDDSNDDLNHNAIVVAKNSSTASRSFTLRAGGYLAQERQRQDHLQSQQQQLGRARRQDDPVYSPSCGGYKYKLRRFRAAFRRHRISLMRVALSLFIIVFVLLLVMPAIRDRLSRRRVDFREVHDPPEVSPQVALCLSEPFDSKLSKETEFEMLRRTMAFTLNPFGTLPPQSGVRSMAEVYGNMIKQRLGVNVRRVRRVLRLLTPKCMDIVEKCHLDDKQLASETCCRRLFKSVPNFTLSSICFVVRHNLSEGTSPIRPSHHQSGLKLAIRHEVFTWHRVFVAVGVKGSSLSERKSDSDVVIEAQSDTHLAIVRRIEEHGDVFDTECDPRVFESSVPSTKCRLRVVQIIAGKSVNCSLISMPDTLDSMMATTTEHFSKTTKLTSTKSICGPLEGLALAFVLREQEALLTGEQELRDDYESKMFNHCTHPCRHVDFEAIVISQSKFPQSNNSNKTLINILPIDEQHSAIISTRVHVIDLLLELLPILIVLAVVVRLSWTILRLVRRRRHRLVTKMDVEPVRRIHKKLSKEDIEHSVWQQELSAT